MSLHEPHDVLFIFNYLFFSQHPVKRNGQVLGLRIITCANHPRNGKMLN